MVITSYNPDTVDLEKTYLANSYSAGITSIETKNTDNFVVNDRIMIGEMGQEKTEIVTVSAVNSNDTTLTIGATNFDHSADDPVYKLRFDQVKFYRSTDGGVNYSVLATVALDVDNEDLTTKYNDTTGLTTYYYKTTVYHSLSAVESDYSDVIGGSGWRRDQVGNIIDEILQEVSDPIEQHMKRGEILGYFNDVNDDLLSAVSKPYDFLHTRSALSRTANRNYIDFPTDANGKQTMWAFDRMDYNFTDTTTDPDTDRTTTIPVMGPEEFRNRYTENVINSTTVTDECPVAMTLDTSVNRFRFSHAAETSAGNVFYLHYWKYFDTIDSEGDVIETPTPRIYKLYIKGMYYRKRAVTEGSFIAMSDRFLADYVIEKAKYKGLDRKDRGTPRGFRPQTTPYKNYRR